VRAGDGVANVAFAVLGVVAEVIFEAAPHHPVRLTGHSRFCTTVDAAIFAFLLPWMMAGCRRERPNCFPGEVIEAFGDVAGGGEEAASGTPGSARAISIERQSDDSCW